MRREQSRETRTSPPRQSSAGHDTLVLCVPHAAYRTILRVWEPYIIRRKDTDTSECRSPLSFVSHVSMTAPGMGSPPVVSTRPSTNIYSPFPSDAIESPYRTEGTVNAEW
jgi:hypothetical protein